MSYFADNEDSLPVVPHARAAAGRASSSRASVADPAAGSGAGSSSRAFLSRLESAVGSPARDGYGEGSETGDSRMGNSRMGDARMGGMGGMDEDDDDDDDEGLDDVRRLGKVWVRERGTVAVLAWEGDLVDSLFDKLEQQQRLVDTLRADPATSEDEHFKLLLVQTEMERVNYLVRSYVRTRLHKIEKYAHHITLTPELQTLLSGAELHHARRYTELVHAHFQSSVLDSLPEFLRRMDETYNDGTSMVTKPNLAVPVLIYCRKDCGEVQLESGDTALLERKTTHLVKYSLVERWIKLGWAEVL
ncbi:GINS complex subunit [Cryptotrichosporon argae]